MADSSRRAISPDDSLPPVEPPSAGFLVQLFLVPALIVGIIVTVWLAFHWLAQLGNDPQAYVRQLRRNTEGRWQAALNLANDLRGPGGATLKADPKLAGELASILDGEVASGRPTGSGHSAEQSRTLCVYLCRALGEFAVPEAAPPLIARVAASDPPEVARAAVEALAVLAANLAAAGKKFADPAAVTTAVLDATQSDDQGLRSSATFALGVVGGDGARDRLEVLCGDVNDDVRYNAALGLARLGGDVAWETLAEMLALPDVVVPPGNEEAQADRYKRAMVVVNALKGVGLLVDDKAAAPPERITSAVAALRDDAVADVRQGATALYRRIERLGTPAE
ncbi:MAG: HEAT repeat domain-containing protein [Planctomycetota bacterium]